MFDHVQDDDDEPLNSADDAESDEEDDVWETDNTIVCQFEKVKEIERDREMQ